MNTTILGIDLGGTNLRGALVKNGSIAEIITQRINPSGSVENVLEDIFKLTDQVFDKPVKAIGIGVPGLVDTENGIIFDVLNIPSWKEVPLQRILQDKYNVPVMINNDANCFALGELHFGKGKGHDSLIGLTIGTGLGTGIIINKKLYAGATGGAGEFGMIDYLDKFYEYYASGQFFQNVYGVDGELVFKKAAAGDGEAIRMYEEMGMHLGNAIKTILYSIDINYIILGGSVRKAYPHFSKTMWERIKTFAYRRAAEGLKIEISELENSGILGAAALYYDRQ